MKYYLMLFISGLLTVAAYATPVQWLPVSGDWEFHGDDAVEHSDRAEPGNRPRVALAGNSSLDNGKVCVTVATRDGVGDIYLIGRWRNADNYYALRYSDPHEKLTLLKMVAGKEYVLAENEKAVSQSPRNEPLHMTLIMDGDRLTGVAGATRLEALASNFSSGASGVGVRYRQGEFSNFLAAPLAKVSDESPVTVVALENHLFERESELLLTLELHNRSTATLKQLRVSCRAANLPEEVFPLAELAGGARRKFTVRIPRGTLKDGDYQMHYSVSAGDRVIAAGEKAFSVLPRRNAQRFEQMLWDNIDETRELKRLGFTAAGTQFYFTSRFADQGDSYAGETAKALNGAEDRLRSGIDSILKIDSRRFWNKKKYSDLFMKDATGKNQLSGDICHNHPEYRKWKNSSLDALGSRIRGNRAVRYVLYDSETENEERKLFQCAHPDCLKMVREAGFAEPPAGVNRVWGMVGASLYGNPKKAGINPDGTIPDNLPEFKYIKWWWLNGSGFVGSRETMAKKMKTYLPNAKSFHDPLLRAPAFLGRAQGLDFAGQWTYTNPSPLSVIENIDELQAAVGNTKPIVPDIQLFWYTNEVIGELNKAEDRKKQAAEAASFVEARDAVHYGRFVTISPDHLTEAVWLAMSRPIAALMLDGGSAISDTPGTYAYTNTDTPEALARIHQELVAPYGPMLHSMVRTPGRVAMLQSVYSSLYGRTGNYGNANKTFADWYNSTILAQLQPDILWDESLASLNGYDVLIIGDAKYLSVSTTEKVRKFAAAGKLVIVDPGLLPKIPAAVSLALTLTDKMSAVDQALAWRANAGKMREVLQRHGYVWPVSAASDNLVIARRLGEGDQTVFLINDARVAGNYVGQYGKVLENVKPQMFHIRFSPDFLTGGKVLYDCLQRRRLTLDENNSAGLFINSGKLLYVATSRITGLSVTPSAKTVKRADSIDLAVKLSSESGLKGTQSVYVEIRDSVGRKADSSGYYALSDGALKLAIPIAGNDVPGFWQIEVHDLIAGFQADNTFQVL